MRKITFLETTLLAMAWAMMTANAEYKFTISAYAGVQKSNDAIVASSNVLGKYMAYESNQVGVVGSKAADVFNGFANVLGGTALSKAAGSFAVANGDRSDTLGGKLAGVLHVDSAENAGTRKKLDAEQGRVDAMKDGDKKSKAKVQLNKQKSELNQKNADQDAAVAKKLNDHLPKLGTIGIEVEETQRLKGASMLTVEVTKQTGSGVSGGLTLGLIAPEKSGISLGNLWSNSFFDANSTPDFVQDVADLLLSKLDEAASLDEEAAKKVAKDIEEVKKLKAMSDDDFIKHTKALKDAGKSDEADQADELRNGVLPQVKTYNVKEAQDKINTLANAVINGSKHGGADINLTKCVGVFIGPHVNVPLGTGLDMTVAAGMSVRKVNVEFASLAHVISGIIEDAKVELDAHGELAGIKAEINAKSKLNFDGLNPSYASIRPSIVAKLNLPLSGTVSLFGFVKYDAPASQDLTFVFGSLTIREGHALTVGAGLSAVV